MGARKIGLVGIAMACYKPDPEALARQLRSIREQTFRQWICVCTFDSDFDGVLEGELFRDFLADERFQFVHNPRRLGVIKNFEYALSVVQKRGVDAIAFADQDDEWFPEKLNILVRELDTKPEGSLVHCDMRVVKRSAKAESVLAESAWKYESRNVSKKKAHHLFVRNNVTGAALLMHASLPEKYGSIPEIFPMHDHWFALCASVEGGVYPVDQILQDYVQHGANEIGVIPYVGMFGKPESVSYKQIFSKAAASWRTTGALVKSAAQQGIPSGILMYLSQPPFFLGAIVLFFLGIGHLLSDRPYSRACFIKSFGYWCSLFVRE